MSNDQIKVFEKLKFNIDKKIIDNILKYIPKKRSLIFIDDDDEDEEEQQICSIMPLPGTSSVKIIPNGSIKKSEFNQKESFIGLVRTQIRGVTGKLMAQNYLEGELSKLKKISLLKIPYEYSGKGINLKLLIVNACLIVDKKINLEENDTYEGKLVVFINTIDDDTNEEVEEDQIEFEEFDKENNIFMNKLTNLEIVPKLLDKSIKDYSAKFGF